MRKIIITIIALLTYTTVSSQNTEKMVKLEEGVYSYSSNKIDDTTHQKGFFILSDGKLERHGIWTLYINGELTTIGKYQKDKLIWFSANNKIHYTNKQVNLNDKRKLASN